MAKIMWGKTGSRYFQAGVDHGVLYPKGSPGVAWDGLISINETPSGGAITPYYVDGVKYLNEVGPEDFQATIEAYTYPEEFAKLDGSGTNGSGLYYENQSHKPFSLAYRTLIGNDVQGVDYGYKLHLIYNAVATPTSKSRRTLSGSPEASTFSWTISCLPIKIQTFKPLSHLVIESKKTDPTRLKQLEDILYGTDKTAPRMPELAEVVTIFDDWSPLEVRADHAEGLAPLVFKGRADLKGDISNGLFTAPESTRLHETTIPGLYSLD